MSDAINAELIALLKKELRKELLAQIRAELIDEIRQQVKAEVAGALVGPDTLRTPGAAEALTRNDAHSWFAKAGAQVVTGPTLTNVNDFRAVLILPPG